LRFKCKNFSAIRIFCSAYCIQALVCSNINEIKFIF
jgi:hypothetical protein